jgi:DNA-binding transcriptional LysR family regulator
MAPIDWSLWRTFLAVAETGSLSAAARRLGITQPTAGRQIAALETALNRRLFLRVAGGLVLEDTALPLVEEARAMSLSAAALDRLAASSPTDVTGVVRIAASHTVAAEVLPFALAPLMASHPGLEVEVTASNSNADLLRREADLAIRMQRPEQGALVARRLADVPLGLFAHRAYLDRAGIPTAARDLAAHVLIGPDRDPVLAQVLAALGPGFTRASLRLRAESEAVQMGALRAGAGIAICQKGIAARDAALVEVLAGRFPLSLDCWLVTHADLRALPRIRAVADHLATTLPALFAGRG